MMYRVPSAVAAALPSPAAWRGGVRGGRGAQEHAALPPAVPASPRAHAAQPHRRHQPRPHWGQLGLGRCC